MKLGSSKCMKCGGLLLVRPDKLPFCSECEKKITAEFGEKLRPDLGKSGKLKLFSQAVEE